MFIIAGKNKLFWFLIYFVAVSILCSSIYIIINHRYTNTEHAVDSRQKFFILIQIDEKKLYLFKDNKCIKQYPITSGKPDWPSPIGEWRIVSKGDWGEGFGGRWMGLNVRWGKYGIHGTTEQSSIGSAASHGCIRMFNKDVKELYDMVSTGTPVIIRNGSFGPFGTGFRELTPGDRGADVLAVQEKLKELGYFKGYESGIYEDDLKSALYKFQEVNNLPVKYTITRVDYNSMGFMEFE